MEEFTLIMTPCHINRCMPLYWYCAVGVNVCAESTYTELRASLYQHPYLKHCNLPEKVWFCRYWASGDLSWTMWPSSLSVTLYCICVWTDKWRNCNSAALNDNLIVCSCCVVMQPKSLEHYLSQEEPQLLNHLKSIGALALLPYDLWFRRCFAGCLPESSLQRSVYLTFLVIQVTTGCLSRLYRDIQNLALQLPMMGKVKFLVESIKIFSLGI